MFTAPCILNNSLGYIVSKDNHSFTSQVACRFGEYDLHDLLELDHQTVGVMIQADAETCQILTNRIAVSFFVLSLPLAAFTSTIFTTETSNVLTSRNVMSCIAYCSDLRLTGPQG